MNTAIFSPSGGSVGIGFAIPSNIAANIVDQLATRGEVRRGFLGTRIMAVGADEADVLGMENPRGALVRSLIETGPAKEAGIEPGDVIIRFDGKDVKNARDLPLMVAQTPVGKQVRVVVWRDGEEITVTLSLGLLDEDEVAATPPADEPAPEPEPAEAAGTVELRAYGLAVEPLTAEDLEALALPGYEAGVTVTELTEDSSFIDQGLVTGDVILEIDNADVASAADVAAAIQAADEDGAGIMAAVIVREGQRIWLILRTR